MYFYTSVYFKTSEKRFLLIQTRFLKKYFQVYLRNRKHFPCFYRVIETRVQVWEKREIAWEHEHEVRVFPRNFEFLPNFHKCFYYSIGTRKKCFLFPLLNSLLKTIKKINLLILIAKYCL